MTVRSCGCQRQSPEVREHKALSFYLIPFFDQFFKITVVAIMSTMQPSTGRGQGGPPGNNPGNKLKKPRISYGSNGGYWIEVEDAMLME
jgi:hypothetical protein